MRNANIGENAVHKKNPVDPVMHQWLRKVVLWIGIVLIGLLSVLVAALLAMISGIWNCTDGMLDRLDQKAESKYRTCI